MIPPPSKLDLLVSPPRPRAPAPRPRVSVSLQLTSGGVLVYALFAAIFGLAAHEIGDPDYWWHLATGRWMLEHRAVMTSDVFSYPSFGRPWVTHEWLAEIVFYLVQLVAGRAGLILLSATLITFAHFLLFRLVRQRGAPPTLAVVVTALAAASGSIMWEARPYLVTFVLTAVFLYVLEGYRTGRHRRLWPLPLLMLVWVNSHGGYLFGLVLCGTYAVGCGVAAADRWDFGSSRWTKTLAEMLARVGVSRGSLLRFPRSASPRRRVSPFGSVPSPSSPAPSSAPAGPSGATPNLRRLVLVTALTAAAGMITPHGWAGVTTPLGLLSSREVQTFVDEWFSPNFHQLYIKPFEAQLLLVLVTLALAGRRLHPVDLLLLVGTTYMALESQRHIPVFAFATAPILAQQVVVIARGWGWRTSSRPPVPVRRLAVALNWLLVGVITAALLWRVGNGISPAANARLERSAYPAGAVEYVRVHPPPGRVFNTYGWGGYLIWQLWPQQLVFVDGRDEVHGGALLRDYVAAYGASPRWSEVLDRYSVGWVLVGPDAPLASVLAASDGWRRVYADGIAVIYERSSPP